MKTFNYSDETGKFFLKRSTIVKGNKIFTKVILFSNDDPDREVEKSMTVTELGVLNEKNGKSNVITRPSSSQYEVWYEGKKYFSQLKTNSKTRKLEVIMKSPVEKWSGRKDLSFPKGKIFCFFSQIPECLGAIGFFKKTIMEASGEISFYIIWNSFPYQNEQFSGLGRNVFSAAKMTYDGESDRAHKFSLEVDNQNIFFNFNKSGDFEKMFWVAQGVTMTVN